MGTIVKRQRKDGSVSYRVQIQVRHQGASHSESKTFHKYGNAKAWLKKREGELDAPGALDVATVSTETLGDLIDWYIDTYRDVLRWGRNKQRSLEQIRRHELAETSAVNLTEARLVDYAQWRRANGSGPATLDNALIWIGVVLKTAKSHGFDVDPAAVAAVRRSMREMGMAASSRRRSRRVTADELQRLYEEFAAGQAKGFIPMHEIVDFAIASSRRRNEILSLRWTDNDTATMTGVVRDAKHPRHKWGNHKRFKYTRAAWDIVQRQPRTSDRIFPYKSSAVTMRFVRACQRAGIVDLRFHDLRHEATSRLFEAGGTITEVQQYTLHESWDMLRRYTQLRPEDVRQF